MISAPKVWEKAVARFQLKVPESSFIDFTNPHKSNILHEVELLANNSKQKCESKQWQFPWRGGQKIPLRRVCGSSVDVLSKCAVIRDMAIQFDPGYATLPWTDFRLILQVSTSDQMNDFELIINLSLSSLMPTT